MTVRQESFLTKLLFFLFCIFSIALIRYCDGFNCYLPEGCRLEKVYHRQSLNFIEKGKSKFFAIVCDINSEDFELKLNHSIPRKTDHTCDLTPEIGNGHWQSAIFRWLSRDESAILDERFNLTNAIAYFKHFKTHVNLNVYGVNGFGLNLFHKNLNLKNTHIQSFELIDIRLEFYHDKKKMNSCQEIIDLNLKEIKSIFQITIAKGRTTHYFILRDVQYKSKICPLVLQNSDIDQLILYGLVNTFYKKSVLTFEDFNFTTVLNSKIEHLQLMNVHDIDLDLNLLNRLVFDETDKFKVHSGSLKSINEETFKFFKNFFSLEINPEK